MSIIYGGEVRYARTGNCAIFLYIRVPRTLMNTNIQVYKRGNGRLKSSRRVSDSYRKTDRGGYFA